MSNNIVNLLHGDVTEFSPNTAKRREAEAEVVKQYAAAVGDWEMLDNAVDQQISDQRNLVGWWTENVGVRLRAGREMNADRRSPLSVGKAQELTGFTQQQISKFRKGLNELDKYRLALRLPSWRKAMGKRGSADQRGASGTGENEWYTPREYVELARSVLGTIDTDPASSDAAQEVVRAKDYYTRENNGLDLEWHGHVWLNPPYAQPLIAEFVAKMCSEYRCGNATEAIMLTHNYTDTAWFHEAANCAGAICFTRGRVKFIGLDGSTAAPTQGQAFFYFGEVPSLFSKIFSSIGFIVRCQN